MSGSGPTCRISLRAAIAIAVGWFAALSATAEVVRIDVETRNVVADGKSYGLAGVLFASNIRSHRHWVSDLVAGALIGTVIGEVVLDGYNANNTSQLAISPYAADDGIGIYFSKSF